MATHRTSSPIDDTGTPSTPPGPPTRSDTAEAHRNREAFSSKTSTRHPGNFSGTGSTSEYVIIPADEEDSPEAIRGSSSANSGRVDEVHRADETEKSSLLYRPLDKLATLKQWTFEFVALFFSVAAFVVMVILLVVIHEKPQPEWAYGVSINSLIAVLTTLLRAAMVFILAEVMGQAKWLWMATPRPLRHVERFDSASRGAWGSLKFLISNCRPAPTVLGALVVIASYATGPFSQQAVKTDRCEISVGGTARISIAERIANLDSPRNTGFLNPEMSVVAVNGLLGTPPDSSQLFQCDSGNCVFDAVSGVTHSSVGVCSNCTDVRSALQEFEELGYKVAGRYMSEYRFRNDSQFGINTRVEPDLFSMTTIDYSSIALRSSFLTLTVAGCVAQPNPEAQANRYCEHDYENMPKLSSDLDIAAADCDLYPCLRHYHGSVTNGTFYEQLLSTEPLRDSYHSKNHEYISVIQPCLLNKKWYDLSNFTDVPRDGLNWTSWSSDGVSFEAPAQCVRSLQGREFNSIRTFLTQNLNGSCHLYDAHEAGSTSTDTIGNNSLLDCDSRWWVGALYGGGNATFEDFVAAHGNMATAITNRMRVNGLTWSESARSYKEGNCRQTSICVYLHWWWLLYPGALLVLTSALLIIAYVQSCQDSGRQPIWKSAILPLLFYSVSKEHGSDGRDDGPDAGSSVPLLQLAELESLADKTIVSFHGDHERARFVVEERMESCENREART